MDDVLLLRQPHTAGDTNSDHQQQKKRRFAALKQWRNKSVLRSITAATRTETFAATVAVIGEPSAAGNESETIADQPRRLVTGGSASERDESGTVADRPRSILSILIRRTNTEGCESRLSTRTNSFSRGSARFAKSITVNECCNERVDRDGEPQQVQQDSAGPSIESEENGDSVTAVCHSPSTITSIQRYPVDPEGRLQRCQVDLEGLNQERMQESHAHAMNNGQGTPTDHALPPSNAEARSVDDVQTTLTIEGVSHWNTQINTVNIDQITSNYQGLLPQYKDQVRSEDDVQTTLTIEGVSHWNTQVNTVNIGLPQYKDQMRLVSKHREKNESTSPAIAVAVPWMVPSIVTSGQVSASPLVPSPIQITQQACNNDSNDTPSGCVYAHAEIISFPAPCHGFFNVAVRCTQFLQNLQRMRLRRGRRRITRSFDENSSCAILSGQRRSVHDFACLLEDQPTVVPVPVLFQATQEQTLGNMILDQAEVLPSSLSYGFTSAENNESGIPNLPGPDLSSPEATSLELRIQSHLDRRFAALNTDLCNRFADMLSNLAISSRTEDQSGNSRNHSHLDAERCILDTPVATTDIGEDVTLNMNTDSGTEPIPLQKFEALLTVMMERIVSLDLKVDNVTQSLEKILHGIKSGSIEPELSKTSVNSSISGTSFDCVEHDTSLSEESSDALDYQNTSFTKNSTARNKASRRPEYLSNGLSLETHRVDKCTEYLPGTSSNISIGASWLVLPTSERDKKWIAGIVADLSFSNSPTPMPTPQYQRNTRPELTHLHTRSLFLSPNSMYLLSCNASDVLHFAKSKGVSCPSFTNHYIHTYILDHVMPCIHQINAHGPRSFIIPVILAEPNINSADIGLVHSVLRELLERHRKNFSNTRIFTEGIVHILGHDDLDGNQQLRLRMSSALQDASGRYLQHVHSGPPDRTLQLREVILRLKKDFPIISLKDLLNEASKREIPELLAKKIIAFLSCTGEPIYFCGCSNEALSEFVVLSKKWLIRVVSCVTRYNLIRRIEREKNFRKLSDEYEDDPQPFPLEKLSKCPILSGNDAAMLWRAEELLGDESDEVVGFLERLFVHYGVFHYIAPRVFLVPKLLVSYVDQPNGWTYKCRDSYKGSLCNVFSFSCHRSPEIIMADVFTKVLRGLHNSAAMPSNTDTQPLLLLKDAQCWRNAFWLKWESADVFVVWLDSWLDTTTSSTPGTRSIAVLGKGYLPHSGRRIWDGGYGQIRGIVSDMLLTKYSSTSEVLCPECLKESNPIVAGKWSWEETREACKSDDPFLHCERAGHRVDSNLLCGTCKYVDSPTFEEVRHVEDSVRESVVIVGMLDSASNLTSIASGFIVDKNRGLVVTVGHAIFDMKNRDLNAVMLGCKTIIARVLPGNHHASAWYFAEIEACNIQNTDLCILRICSRVEIDQFDQPGRSISPENIHEENLRELSLSKYLFQEERIGIIGYPHSKSDTGLCEVVARVEGRVQRCHKLTDDDDKIQSDVKGNHRTWQPREEIVVNSCSGVQGQSGGPCLNDDGDVVGIYCRGHEKDYVDYLIPASGIRDLLGTIKD